MNSLLPEYRIDVVEERRAAQSGRIPCVIDEHLRFDAGGIETYCLAGCDAKIYDAFVLGAAVQFCDHAARRPSTNWGRDITLRVPVHHPDRWRSADVSNALHDALSLVTGDHWRIDFAQRATDFMSERQQSLDFPRSSVVMPFSDGLDSYVVAHMLEREHADALVPVRLGSNSLPRRRAPTSPTGAFASMPWRVSYGDSGSVETSARSRGFRFALLSGVAAFLCNSRRIVLPESGQGVLGPPLTPVGQAYPDFRNHPSFGEKMEMFLSALFNHKVQYEYPQLWRTKGQTLAEFFESHPDDTGWMGTRSCRQGARQVSVSGSLRQCGICAACLLRRMSVHAAGRCEDPESYVWEDLSATRFEDGAAHAFANRRPKGALHEYAIAGVLHLDHLARLRRSPAQAAALERHAFLLSRSLDLGEEETHARLKDMLQRHEEEWRRFLDSLGSRSFVAQWVAQGH